MFEKIIGGICKMNEQEIGTHKGHCCVKHGCKYGNKDCPVVARRVIQDYTCEECSMAGIQSVPELTEQVRGEVKGTYKIEVIMEPDKEMAEQGTSYFWSVLRYDGDNWYISSSGWSKSPKMAFLDANWQYEILIGD
jgi:hypothetical protein